jgi:hypothetical protein
VSNWGASFAEDAMVLGGIWFAFEYPLVFLGLLALFILLVLWMLPKLWRGVRAVVRRLSAPEPVGLDSVR